MGLSDETKKKIALAVAVIGALFTMGMSLASFISAEKSYSFLKEIKGDYEVHIKHWESLPIIDVQVVGETDSCPWGTELGEVSLNDRNALQTIGQFPGSEPWCDCREGGFEYKFTYTEFWCLCGSGKRYDGTTYYSTSPGAGHCSENAARAGCYTDSKEQNATETWTTRQNACHPNATAAGCANDEAVPSVDLHVWKHHKLCYKRGGWTSLERIEALDIDDKSCKSGVICQEAHATQDPSNTICAERYDLCPLVALGNISFLEDTNETHPILNVSFSMEVEDGNNYLPIVEIRQTIGSPCWKGSFGQNGRSNNPRVGDKYHTDCTTDDTRFVYWDAYAESSLYNENDVETGGNNLMGDGSYSPVQYYNESTDVDWRLSYRRQIFWSSDCESGDITDLAAHLKPLRRVVDYQLALLIVNCIFGLIILGLCIPIIMLMHACDKDHDLPCIPGEGEDERNNLNRITKCVSFVSKIAKMIPLVLCLVVTDEIHWFFSTAGEAECSDPLTNTAMGNLGDQINELKDSNYTTLYLDIVMCCWYLVPLSLWIYKKFIKGESDEGQTTPGGEGAEPLQIQPTAPPMQQPVVYVQAPGAPPMPQPGYMQAPMQQPVYVQQAYPQAVPLSPDLAATRVQAAWKGHQVIQKNPNDPMAQFYYQ